MKIDFEKLERDISLAQKEADKFRNVDDGGTCNFDTVTIFLGRRSKAKMAKIAELDWSLIPVDSKYWSGYWFVFFNVNGQANRRSEMVEAAGKKMRELGWNVRMYYEMD